MRLTIAVDIDGTLRNLEKNIEYYLELDHPDKIEGFAKNKGNIYRSLDNLFETKEDLYRWMYEERVFELFGRSPKLHPKVIDDLNFFASAAEKFDLDVVIASVQKNQSITATMFWLAKNGCKIKRYEFFNSMEDKINRNFDFYVDDCPDVLNAVIGQTKCPQKIKNIGSGVSRAIKIPYGFTSDIDCPSLDIANGKFDDIYEIFEVEKILKK